MVNAAVVLLFSFSGEMETTIAVLTDKYGIT